MEASNNSENTPSAPFVHLHVHTQYSLLDGAIRLEDLIAKAKANNMPALAITDPRQHVRRGGVLPQM